MTMERRRLMTILAWILAAAAVVALLLGGNTLLRYLGVMSKKQSPDEISRLLSPSYRIYMPLGDGRWPTVLLFSGCDGPKDNMERWATMLNAEGWGAIIVDSHTPRGYDDAQIWRLICAGQLLTGGERAGDVAVALDDARKMPFVDADHIVLLGSSHGGWSILDMLSLLGQRKLPFNLSRWPDSVRDQGLTGVAGTVLLYPYCGPGSQVSRKGWGDAVPALFLLVEDDSIADEESCLKVTGRMTAQGHDVEMHLLQGTTHGFDQAEKNLFSMLEFSPEAIDEATGFVRQFLARVGP